VAPFGQLHRQAAASRTSMRRTFEYRHNVRLQPRRLMLTPAAVGCKPCQTDPRNGDIHRALQAKFAASFVLPTPLYSATCG
jgi:hypothetical protein